MSSPYVASNVAATPQLHAATHSYTQLHNSYQQLRKATNNYQK